ncbi:Intraflagellar transport protein 56 [Homalodisca vitripennis]|nr:Intraflagellar transport protein 56 [Homalodisca vitripennis]
MRASLGVIQGRHTKKTSSVCLLTIYGCAAEGVVGGASVKDAFDILTTLPGKISQANGAICRVGDLNIDRLGSSWNEKAQPLIAFLLLMTRLDLPPTRIANNSVPSIDMVYNNLDLRRLFIAVQEKFSQTNNPEDRQHGFLAGKSTTTALTDLLQHIIDIIEEEYKEAFLLVKDLEPSVPQEYILKGVVNVAIGQESGSREHIKVAQQFFQLVGSSASECDTIPGRQCMASSFFLQRQFDDVMLYLSSIKSYYCNDDSFNFNYAQAKAALGHFKEAEEIFLMVQNEKLQNDYIYISHLARCYVMSGKPQSAWELYLKMETSADSFSLLQVLANDCYRMGQFWHAAKAFDMLERLDPSPEYWEGKRGACAGVFQLIIAGRQPKELLADVIQLLRNTANPQVETIIWTMKRWAKENKLNV